MDKVSDYTCLADIPESTRVFLNELNPAEVEAAEGVENFLNEQVKISKSLEKWANRKAMQYRLAEQRRPYEEALVFVHKHKVV